MEQDIIFMLEREINHVLTPIEIEIINDWKSEGFNDNQIRDAIKEATKSGIITLRYIGKILKSWKPTVDGNSSNDQQEQDLSWLE